MHMPHGLDHAAREGTRELSESAKTKTILLGLGLGLGLPLCVCRM